MVKGSVSFGRGAGTRTPGTRFWRPLLYQLSYTPIFCLTFQTLELYHKLFRFAIGFSKKVKKIKVKIFPTLIFIPKMHVSNADKIRDIYQLNALRHCKPAGIIASAL